MFALKNYYLPFRRKSVDDGTVEYRVQAGPGDYNLTFTNEAGTQQLPAIRKKWKYSFKAKPGDYFYCSAQANHRKMKVLVKVFFNGRLCKKLNKNGDFVIATVSGCAF